MIMHHRRLLKVMKRLYNILGFKMYLNLAETHHGYYGIALMITGAFVPVIGSALIAFGFYLLADDIYQHHRQAYDRDYHSPVHRWYVDELYTFGWIKKLNMLLDDIFS